LGKTGTKTFKQGEISERLILPRGSNSFYIRKPKGCIKRKGGPLKGKLLGGGRVPEP